MGLQESFKTPSRSPSLKRSHLDIENIEIVDNEFKETSNLLVSS